MIRVGFSICAFLLSTLGASSAHSEIADAGGGAHADRVPHAQGRVENGIIPYDVFAIGHFEYPKTREYRERVLRDGKIYICSDLSFPVAEAIQTFVSRAFPASESLRVVHLATISGVPGTDGTFLFAGRGGPGTAALDCLSQFPDEAGDVPSIAEELAESLGKKPDFSALIPHGELLGPATSTARHLSGDGWDAILVFTGEEPEPMAFVLQSLFQLDPEYCLKTKSCEF